MNAATSEARKFSPSPRPDHQRRVAPRADHHVRRVGVRRDQGERALEPAADLPHRLGEVAAAVACRVASSSRCATTSVSVSELSSCPRSLELGPQPREVLDDPVVDHGDRAGAVDVRVGVAVVGRAVGGPAGVPDAGGGRQRVVGSALSRLTSLPARFAVASPPSASRRPRPSRSPGTPAARPSITTSSAGWSPTYPTMPHMGARLSAVPRDADRSRRRRSTRRDVEGACGPRRPCPLTADDLARLRGLGEPIDLDEVEEIYLPLSRLLNLYVGGAARAAPRRPRPSSANGRPGPRSSSASPAPSRSASPPRRGSCARCSPAGRTTRGSSWSPPTASCCPTPS